MKGIARLQQELEGSHKHSREGTTGVGVDGSGVASGRGRCGAGGSTAGRRGRSRGGGAGSSRRALSQGKSGGVLGTALHVGLACSLAFRIVRVFGDTLAKGGLTLVEGNGLDVGRAIGDSSVGADTGVAEILL